MRFDLKQMLMLMALLGLIAGLGVSVSRKTVSSEPSKIDVSPDGTKVATLFENGLVAVYDFDTGSVRTKQVNRGSWFSFLNDSAISFFSDNELAISLNTRTSTNTCKKWNLKTNQVEDLNSDQFGPNIDAFAVGGFIARSDLANGLIKLEHLTDKSRNRSIKKDISSIYSTFYNRKPVHVSDDDRRILVIAAPPLTKNTGTATGAKKGTKTVGAVPANTNPTFNPGGQTSSEICLIEIASGTELGKIEVEMDWTDQTVLSPGGKYVVRFDTNSPVGNPGQYGTTIRVLDESLQEIYSINRTRSPSFIAFSKDDSKMAVVDQVDSEIKIYQAKDGTDIQTINRKPFESNSWIGGTQTLLCGFDETGNRIYVAAQNSDGGVEVWDIDSGAKLKTLGRIQRFWPGVLFAIGFCIWAAIWGLISRSKFRRQMLVNAEGQSGSFDDEDPFDSVTGGEADESLPAAALAVAEPVNPTGYVPSAKPPVVEPISIGFDNQLLPEAPRTIKAIWILMGIGGLWAIFYACISVFYITISGYIPWQYSISAIRYITTVFVLVTGLLAFSRGIGRYPRLLYLTTGLQISTFLACDFINFILGVAGLVLTSSGQSPEYLRYVRNRLNSRTKL